MIYSQQDTLKNNKKEFVISTNPIQLLYGDFVNYSIGIPLGFELKINDKGYFHQDISYITKAHTELLHAGTLSENSLHISDKLNGIRLESELKRFLTNKKNFTGFYFSTTFFYQFTNSKHNSYLQTTNRNVLALHEKIGWEVVGPFGDFFDFALGIGIRYEFSNTNTQNKLLEFNQYVDYLYMYNKPYQYGSKLFFSINGTLRYGRIIHLKK